MPKILVQQPQWLDRGTPGFDFFQTTQSAAQGTAPSKAHQPGCRLQRIALRGTEIFAAVGNELRWSDVETWREHGSNAPAKSYKVLKVPTSRPIFQLTISPSGDFLAVLTSHTCHVCVLPASERLQSPDTQPIKLRSFQLGPTAHVLEQSPLATAVWHPLSPSGNGLVTVTKDACVRLWELDSNNRNSFDEPALAIDLKKLGNATSTREDFSASKFGANKGYTIDDVEMQVASSCFGGQGREDEDAWSSMTLWVAMTEGDVYALCPFLPSHFWAPANLLPSLTTSVVSKARIFEHDGNASDVAKRIADQQCKWLTELDQQDPTLIPGDFGVMEVYARPERPGVVPKLQGPFQLTPEPDFGEITDIHVVAPRIDQDALFDDEEEDDFDVDKGEGLSLGVICLATNASQVYVCLNLEGVEAEWLPSKRPRMRAFDDDFDGEKELLLLETLDCGSATASANSDFWPTFTASPADRYELFTTQPSGIYHISFRPWMGNLEDELAAPQKDAEGSSFRLNVLLSSTSTAIESITAHAAGAANNLDAAVAVFAPETDLGHVVLTALSCPPLATVLDVPAAHAHPFGPDTGVPHETTVVAPARPAYQPPEAFFKQSAFPAQLDTWRRESAGGARGDVHAPVRFSPWTLQRITEAHRLLSTETHDIGIAAADLYRRCQRMVNEMKDQIENLRALSNRVDSVTGEDNFSESVAGQPDFVRGGRERVKSRIRESHERTADLQRRVDRLKVKMRSLGGKELSAKEHAFAEEVATLHHSIIPPAASADSPARVVRMENSELTTSTASFPDTVDGNEGTISARYDAIVALQKSLVEQATALQARLDATTAQQQQQDTQKVAASASSTAANDYRARKMAQVFSLLDRETAMIEAVSERLNRLQA